MRKIFITEEAFISLGLTVEQPESILLSVSMSIPKEKSAEMARKLRVLGGRVSESFNFNDPDVSLTYEHVVLHPSQAHDVLQLIARSDAVSYLGFCSVESVLVVPIIIRARS
jgi:hypothetical protein